MILGNLEIEMPPSHRQFSRVDTVELKSRIFKKLGRVKAEKYFNNLKRLLGLKLSKNEFDKLCYGTIGRENFALHNLFIKSILMNACLAHATPERETITDNSCISKISNGSFGDSFLASSRNGRSVNRDRRFRLGHNGKMCPGNSQEITSSCNWQRSRDKQSAPELISVGSKALPEVGSVEDGEEVEQVKGSPGVQSRSPLRAPLGIPISVGGVSLKVVRSGPAAALHLPFSDVLKTCLGCSELPDSSSLRKQLEQKVELEGLGLSVNCDNLLNNSLDAFMKRLIKPCMELARARCSDEQTNQSFYASLLDFRMAMESNPRLLGVDWPVQLEKICLRTLEE